ncbi:MAG: type II toxin-antitoxin system RelB/DinJ family antitoxin [Proteobacteria bacterium]|nr:type II toxin-antitoxin system RelB/DinJ family antitoxin [Pseudomonadota bacterium]
MTLHDDIIRARIDHKVKIEAQKILDTMGLSVSDAIRLFFYQIVAEQKIPFPIKAPNFETIKALQAHKEKELEPTTLENIHASWKNG